MICDSSESVTQISVCHILTTRRCTELCPINKFSLETYSLPMKDGKRDTRELVSLYRRTREYLRNKRKVRSSIEVRSNETAAITNRVEM